MAVNPVVPKVVELSAAGSTASSSNTQHICPEGTKSTVDEKNGAIMGTSVISIVYIAFLAAVFLYYMGYEKGTVSHSPDSFLLKAKKYLISIFGGEIPKHSAKSPLKHSAKSPLIHKSPSFDIKRTGISGNFYEWTSKVSTSINSEMLIAIMASGVVIGFNSFVMSPMIGSIFPDSSILQPIKIPGKSTVTNPGLFMVNFIGFVLSLLLLFFVIELVKFIKSFFVSDHSGFFTLENTTILIIFMFLTIMLVWNAMHLYNFKGIDSCVDVNFDISSLNPFNNKTQITRVGALSRNSRLNSPKLANSVGNPIPIIIQPTFGVF